LLCWIQTVLNILSPVVEEKEAEIRVQIPKECFISGMRGPLNQVFMNVIKNALDAIERKGKISFGVENQNGSINIRIKDDGVGIKAEDLDCVFDPFFTSKGPDHGTGLGLSISHRVIRSHHGEIKIQSCYGKGTTVYITLPKKVPKGLSSASLL